MRLIVLVHPVVSIERGAAHTDDAVIFPISGCKHVTDDGDAVRHPPPSPMVSTRPW
jgi:hypothetical protein